METATAELRNRLTKIMRTAYDGPVKRDFFSRTEIEQLLGLDSIRTSLSQIPILKGNTRDTQRYASIIHQTSLLVLATLLFDGNESHIMAFVFRRDTDERIPYSEDSLYYLPELVRSRFVQNQWKFSPVVLELGGIHRVIQSDAIIPIISETKVGDGGFGTVWKTRLCPTSQTLVALNNDQEAVIARKQLAEGHTGANERTILELLKSLKHPNIIEFLGSYSYHGVCSLLFPLASMDLREFLFAKISVSMDTHSIYAAIYGIADALDQIHNFSLQEHNSETTINKTGYHHDLRPANILVHRGTFVIADFGLSRLRPDNQDSKTTLNGGSDDYLGPESFNYNDWTNGSVGRALDVWALGCIVAELATFIRGWDMVAFQTCRKGTHGETITNTNNAFHLKGDVHPEVTRWLEDLVKESNDAQLTDLVQIARDMLNPNQYRRPKVSDIMPRLKLLAIDSAFSATDRRFLELVGDCNTPDSATNVFAFLEHTRAQTWHSAFMSTHPAVKLECASSVLASLTKLSELLKQNALHHGNHASLVPTVLPADIVTEIDSLCETLPDAAQKDFSDMWSRRVCDIDDIQILESIRLANMPERYRLVGISAAMKHMSVAISKSIKFGHRSRFMESSTVELDHIQVRLPGSPSDQSKTLGYLATGNEEEQRRVMIEWKVYTAYWAKRASDLFERMDNLANLLDPEVTPRLGIAEYRIPKCLGFFHDPGNRRFGFVYSLTEGVDGQEALLFSLNNVMRFTTKSDLEVTMPDLGDVFLLAKDLAACLLAVHQTGWLHKSLSSYHVLVFSPSVADVLQYVASAVLAGFNDSRPEASGVTLGPNDEYVHYKHPEYVPGTVFRRTFDYFGLGIVLLELGLWVVVSDLKKEHIETTREEFRLKLLNSYVPQLGAKMGVMYRDAVRFCLDAEDEARRERLDPENIGAMHSMFEARVVNPLSQCFA